MNYKVWTYVIGRLLDEHELIDLLADGRQFAAGWTAHEQQLEATFDVFNKRIVIVKVNEDVHNASGCSIDKLGRFMKEAGAKYRFDAFNRLLVAYKKDGGIEVTHAGNIKELLEKQLINEDTLVYNTAISSENELAQWEQPLKNSWLKKYLPVKN